MSSRWWSTARSIRIQTRRDEILYFSNFKSRNGSNMIFFRIHMDPLDHWSVKPHTTCLNFLSILTKQCTILNTTHCNLSIPLDQTHPFLKGFYSKRFRLYSAALFSNCKLLNPEKIIIIMVVTTISIKSVSFCSFLPNAKELGREISEWWSEKYDNSYGTKIAITLKKMKKERTRLL